MIGHDLILFPLYALAERLIPAPRRPRRRDGVGNAKSARVPLTNYVRIPTMAAGLMFLLFFPASSNRHGDLSECDRASRRRRSCIAGLLLVAAAYLISATWYVVKTIRLHYIQLSRPTKGDAQR